MQLLLNILDYHDDDDNDYGNNNDNDDVEDLQFIIWWGYQVCSVEVCSASVFSGGLIDNQPCAQC